MKKALDVGPHDFVARIRSRVQTHDASAPDHPREVGAEVGLRQQYRMSAAICGKNTNPRMSLRASRLRCWTWSQRCSHAWRLPALC